MKSRSYSQYFQSFSARLNRDISSNQTSIAKRNLSKSRQWPMFRTSGQVFSNPEWLRQLFPEVGEIGLVKLFYLVSECGLKPDTALEIFDMFDVELGTLEDVATSAFRELIGFSEPIDPIEIVANEAFAYFSEASGFLTEFAYLDKVYVAIGEF